MIPLAPNTEPYVRASLLRELAILLNLVQDCHYACRYMGISSDAGSVSVVMFKYKTNLSAHFEAQGGLEAPQALEMARDIARGLEEIHELGVLAEVLRPSNVLVTMQGSAVISDFGIKRATAVALGPAAKPPPPSVEEFNYMAPEQMMPATAANVSPRTDTWAFACTFIYMLTGDVPMPGLSIMEIKRKVRVWEVWEHVCGGIKEEEEEEERKKRKTQ